LNTRRIQFTGDDDSLFPVDLAYIPGCGTRRDRSNFLAIIESGLLDFSPL